MKTLVLVRHAKSSWKDENLDDVDRPLSKRGKRTAPIMAAAFAARDIELGLVLCSPAKRARRTARIFCDEIGYQWHEVVIVDFLYAGDAEEILDMIKRIDDSVDAVMMFGHNPELTELAHRFSPTAIANVPTAGVVTMVFDTSHWKKLPTLVPVAFDFDHPKKHVGGDE